MARWFSGLMLGGVVLLSFLLVQSACGGVVETSDTSSGGAPTQTYACPICANAKLSCVVNKNTDTLTRAASSKTGCAFDFGSSAFSVDCDTQTFCIEGFGCSSYTASGSSFSVKTELGPVQCSPAK